MPDSYYTPVEQRGELTVSVVTYPPEHVDRSSAAVQEFRAAAKARLALGMTVITGPDKVPAGVVAPLVSFHFRREHIPFPMEDILEWLRGHPLVRLIEIERHTAATRST